MLMSSRRCGRELGDDDAPAVGAGREASKSETKAKLPKGAPPPPIAGQM